MAQGALLAQGQNRPGPVQRCGEVSSRWGWRPLLSVVQAHLTSHPDLNKYLQQKNEDTLQSHQQAIRLLKEKAQQEMDTARDRWQEQHQKEFDELRLELTCQQTATMKQISRNHKQQLSCGLRELERALENSLKQEREEALHCRELQLALTDGKQSLHMVQRDNEKLRWELSDLENKLEDRVRMMNEVQTDVSNHFRNCIEEMKQRLESERQQLTADHVHENHNLMHEYTAAQDLLKEKISTLENELLEAQKALKQWKRWPDDRQRISHLQGLLAEQEQHIRSLMEDRKYYELELANREVNYNKIFNANPKVGIVNPLQKGDCKNGGAHFPNASKFNSLPIGGRGRLLPPLSGTMQHDQRFSLCDRIFSMTPPSKLKKQFRDQSASSGLPCLNGK
uniref:protein FAM184A-like isoform X2 n=1 Tax=Myxine glutinosa TaxID=7769 RepID=UPI00358EBE4C